MAKKSNPFKKSNIMQRATTSAVAGLPIAYAVNMFIFIPIVYLMEAYPQWMVAGVGAIPFFITSIMRMYLIDWVWFKYNINIDPVYMATRWYHNVRCYF